MFWHSSGISLARFRRQSDGRCPSFWTQSHFRMHSRKDWMSIWQEEDMLVLALSSGGPSTVRRSGGRRKTASGRTHPRLSVFRHHASPSSSANPSAYNTYGRSCTTQRRDICHGLSMLRISAGNPFDICEAPSQGSVLLVLPACSGRSPHTQWAE